MLYLLKRALSKIARVTDIRSFQRVKANHVEPEALDCLKRFDHGNFIDPLQYILLCYVENLEVK
jgi:hypothetical protein